MTDNARHSQQPLADAPVRLTPRERQVLLWCAYGKSSWEIGQILECKESTVNFHVSNILRKFDVPTRVAAVIKAIPSSEGVKHGQRSSVTAFCRLP